MTILDDQKRNDLLIKIAVLYYEHDLNQQQIADKVGFSRPMISRMLKEAKDKGIIRISINYPWKTSPLLEDQLIDAFKLSEAIVLISEQSSYEKTVSGLGILAAKYFEGIVNDNMTIGISWGSALHHMINNIQKANFNNLRVVQFVGATGSENPPIHGPFLAQLLSSRLNATCNLIFAPAIVSTTETKKHLLTDPTIKNTYAFAAKCDVAFLGIGTTKQEYNSMMKVGYLNNEDVANLRQVGAVGDVCLNFYSKSGKIINCEFSDRAMAIPADIVRSIPNVIGVAGGSIKGEAIFGALKSRLIKTLITDDQAAKAILLLNKIHQT